MARNTRTYGNATLALTVISVIRLWAPALVGSVMYRINAALKGDPASVVRAARSYFTAPRLGAGANCTTDPRSVTFPNITLASI